MTQLIENDTDTEKSGLGPLQCLYLLPTAGVQVKGFPLGPDPNCCGLQGPPR